MAKVTVIPPSSEKPKSLRVAAYCRVSTDYSDQLHSYAAQIRNYTELIEQHEGWELVDIYADEAQSGTRMDKREDFNRMMADCRKGKIDRILVKSVSRFARNTHDCLIALRELMRLGVTVKFEEDNIDTGMLTNEMLVSISGALAQQESVSISQNMKMSYKRRMEKGEFITQVAPFGYRLVNKRELEIDPEQAKVVKWIFEAYLSGHGINWIAKQLTLKGIKTNSGLDEWDARSVGYIITNEKYVGDTLCQKTFVSGFPYKSVINRGELDQYYIESTHPAIIDRETFDRAQQFYRQKISQRNPLPKSSMSLKIKCGVCGGILRRTKTRKHTVFWRCGTYLKEAAKCPICSIRDSEIQAAFVRMYNKLKLHKGTILHPAAIQLDELAERVNRNNPAMLEVNKAIAQIAEQNYKISKLQADGLIDNDVCAAKISMLNAKMDELRTKRRKLVQNDNMSERIEAIKQMIDQIESGPKRLEDFNDEMFTELVECITAESLTCIRFRLYGGIELTERLRGIDQW